MADKKEKKTKSLGTLSRLARAASIREVDKDNNQRLLLGVLSNLYGLNEQGDPRFLGGLGRGYEGQPGAPGIMDEALALPTLVESIGLEAPEFAKKAEARSNLLRQRMYEEMDITPPRGLRQHGVTAIGEMLGQLPVAGKSIATKAPGWLQKLSGPLRAAVEYISPTIRPSAKNYASGAAAGALLGTLSDEPEEQVVKESRGGRMDDLSSLRRKYAEGGQVRRNTRAVKAIRDAIAHLEAGDNSAAATVLRASDDAMSNNDVADIARAMVTPRKKPAMAAGGTLSRLIKETLAKVQTGVAPPPQVGGGAGGPNWTGVADKPVTVTTQPPPPTPGVPAYQAVNEMAQRGRQGGPQDASFYYSYGAGPEQRFFSDARYVNAPPPPGAAPAPGAPGAPPPAPGAGPGVGSGGGMDLNGSLLWPRGRGGIMVRLPDGTGMSMKEFKEKYGWLPTEYYKG